MYPSFKLHLKYMPKIARRSARIAKAETVVNYNKDVGSSESDSVEKKEKVSDGKKSRIRSPFIDNTFRERYLSQNNRDNLNQEIEDYATICHQCQEFTPGTKAHCRNDDCVAVNKEFCGPCLSNYYGEDLESALKDPKWHCPFCRGICSFSLCEVRSNTPILDRFDNNKVVDPRIEDEKHLQTDENSKLEYQDDAVDAKCGIDDPKENSAFAENND